MLQMSPRYSHAACKKIDGMPLGSASLWGARAAKAYGALPIQAEHDMTLERLPPFDYNQKQIAHARHFRSGFYERILSPNEILEALHYTPVILDIEIFDSIYNDQGVVTLPDENEDKKEDFNHCVNVLGYRKETNSFFINTHWPQWGDNGFGLVPLEYLDKYFITAFAGHHLVKMSKESSRLLKLKKKVKSKLFKGSIQIFSEPSYRGDKRALFNMEVFDAGGNIAGWIHCAIDKQKTLEVLDLFVLEEYRNRGIGSFLLRQARLSSRAKNITGFIASHDLIGEREEKLKEFLLENGLIPIVDKSAFKDCRYRIEKL